MFKRYFLIVFLIVLLMTSFAFASGEYNPPVNCDYHIKFSDCYYYAKEPFMVFKRGDYHYIANLSYALNFNNNDNRYFVYYNNDGDLVEHNGSYGISGSPDLSSIQERLVWANHDINSTFSDEVFYLGPIPPDPVVVAITGIPQALVGQMRRILPVGFGVLSAMLLVMLLTGCFRRWLYRSTL